MVTIAKRRPNGDGAVRKRADGRWEARIIVGHEKSGDPIFRYVLAKTQREVTEKLHSLMDSYKGAELTDESRMMLGQWLEKWMEEYMINRIRPSTSHNYRILIRCHILPYLGDKCISQVTSADVQKMYNHLKKFGRVSNVKTKGTELSDSMVRSIHMLLHEAMETAVKERLIVANPTESVTIPRANHRTMQVLTDNQIEKFLYTVKTTEPMWYDFFYTELTTGLRRGEICGLKWQDFDVKSGKLSVRRTLTVGNDGMITEGETKTASGKRTIQLPQTTVELLRKRLESALTDWIFPNMIMPEEPVKPNTAYLTLKKLLRRAELPDIRLHDLRHTFATVALKSGVDAKTLSGILGHTNASFTLDTYTHVTTDMQKQAAGIIGGMIDELIGDE